MMATVALVLAAAAAAGGVWLLRSDARDKNVSTTPPESRATSEPAPPEPPETPEPDTHTPVAYEDSEPLDVEVEQDLNNVPVRDPKTPIPEADRDSEPEPEPAPDTEHAPQRDWLPTFGRLRRQRRDWAQHMGAEFHKTDDFLQGEWGRRVGDEVPRDVVSGVVLGAEFQVCDIADTTIVAFRRGAESDIIIEATRPGVDPDPDLVHIADVQGFAVAATDQGVGKRALDARVEAALSGLPAVVPVVWAENGWVVAQCPGEPADWEACLEPLKLLADALRVLPPRANQFRELDTSDLDPSRPLPPAPPILVGERALEPESAQPAVLRPEEPPVLPRRGEAASRGEVGQGWVGADDVAAIGERPREVDPRAGTRMVRDLEGTSEIFKDYPQR
ncbi:hypothetical protein [Corynebacterium renale]|nr:hypothetical protein [Corynebacterium renale]